jgi:hypothetical protein
VIQLKQGAGVLGLLAALAGIALNNRLVIWVAIGLFGVSIVLRILIRVKERRSQRDDVTT